MTAALTKPDLMLLPGFLCDESVWHWQRSCLENRYRLALPTLRGQNSFAAMAEHALGQAPERFSLIAHSMGAKVAFQMLHQAAERIDRLVVMSTSVDRPAADEVSQRQTLMTLAREQGMEAVAESLLEQMLHPSRQGDTALVSSLRRMMAGHSIDDLEQQIQASLTRPDIESYLPDISQPVLIMCGADDQWSSVEQHRDILRLIPGARLEVLPETGHMLMMEQPERVNSLLLDFLGA